MYLRKMSAQNIKQTNKTITVSISLNLLPSHGEFCPVPCCSDTTYQHDLKNSDFLPLEMCMSSQHYPQTHSSNTILPMT